MAESIIITDKGYKDLNPVQFGYEKCKKSHSYGPAVRTHWLIHFVVSGFGFYKIGDREYKLGPGEMFVIPPYTETYYEADDKNPWNYIWIGFQAGNTLTALLSDTILCPEAASIFNAMKNCQDLINSKSSFLCARLWDLFALLSEKEKYTPDYVETALDCIHSEYMNGITIEEIARRLNLDRAYFSTIFKKKMGISPKQYLQNHRMTIAASLMLKNKKSVSVAAYSVGYTNIFNFSKMFKRHFGLSPSEYIKVRQVDKLS